MVLQEGDIFICLEKDFYNTNGNYEGWPEISPASYAQKTLQTLANLGLDHYINIQEGSIYYDPARIYTTKKISKKEALHWYNVAIAYIDSIFGDSPPSNVLEIVSGKDVDIDISSEEEQPYLSYPLMTVINADLELEGKY